MNRLGLHLEADAAAETVLRHFGPDATSLPQEGAFWSAVAQAHRDGFTGRGRRVAIIDSAFDVSHPQLAGRCAPKRMVAPPGESPSHGTAVALLISAVAPEAVLDLYEVARDGAPSERAIHKAFALAAASNAEIINFSIGHTTQDPAHRCTITAAVDLATKAGKVVVVAVGNEANQFQCPAQHPGLAGVGYNAELRWIQSTDDGGFEELAQWQPPSFAQSLEPAFTISQPLNVLGSSFAAPLAAGLAALAHDPRDVLRVSRCGRFAATAAEREVDIDSRANAPDLKELLLLDALYEKALSELPHHESSSRCPGCAFLTQWILTNAGRWNLKRLRLEPAKDLLRRALSLAPWSPDATATLGRAIEYEAEQRLAAGASSAECLAMLRYSEQLYLQALEQRPMHKAYRTELVKIRAMMDALDR